jgi:hypothetical protein
LSTVLTKHHGAYFLRNNFDPDYNYLLNSLSVLYLRTPGHTDHPGTTLQILGAAILLLKWLGISLVGHRQTLADSVLAHPEEYLRTINVVLNVLIAATLYWSAWCIYRLSNSLFAAALLQVTVLVYLQTFLALFRVSPEPLLLAVGLALMAPLAPMVIRRDGTNANENRLAVAAGALFGFGLITKITFAPWAAVILLFPKRSLKTRFVAAAATAILLLLLPVTARLPDMATWFTSLLFHAGHYGTGRIGIPEAHTLVANFVSLWQVEPPLFLFLALYAATLLLLRLFRPQGTPLTDKPQLLLLAACIAIIAGIIMVVKHPAYHYLLPVLVLTAFVNSGLWAVLPHSELSGTAVRGLSLAALVMFIGIGLFHNWFSLWWWVGAARTDRQNIAELDALEERLPGCQIIGSFRSSLEPYALSFANFYSAGVHGGALEKLYPGTINYDPFHYHFGSFAFGEKDQDVKRLVSNGQCVLLESTPLDAGALKQFDGIRLLTLMTAGNPLIPSDPTTLYRLQPPPPP